MSKLIKKLLKVNVKALADVGISQKDIQDALFEICEDVHSSCDGSCPVYELNGHSIPWEMKGKREVCKCFKDGRAMARFIWTEQNK